MGPVRRLAVLTALTAVVVAATMPAASAGPASFEDPEGDGTPFEAPVPASEPNLDIVQVR